MLKAYEIYLIKENNYCKSKNQDCNIILYIQLLEIKSTEYKEDGLERWTIFQCTDLQIVFKYLNRKNVYRISFTFRF